MSLVLEAAGPRPQGNLQFPLALYLSPRIPPDRAALLRGLISAQPRYARLSDAEEGALHVLPDFQLEELAALERRKRRIIGLPFVERFLKDRSVLSRVPALPLFDLIYRSPNAICFSALSQDARIRCNALARWIGARSLDELGPGVDLLVTARVSLHPDSKYQAALKSRLPVVRPSYLEAIWEAKQQVDVEPHYLPALAGLAICFDPRQAEVTEAFQRRAAAQGAVMAHFNKAEVVIVTDVSRPLYKDARKLGMLAAPPVWLERCLQLRCCVPISGELEVPQPGATMDASPASVESSCNMSLIDCVLCLLYLEPGKARDTAKAHAWKCGAHTTLDPNDKAITHVLFNSLPNTLVHVSVPVDEDRISFLDVSWLETCAGRAKRVKESEHQRQRVSFSPSCDTAYAAAKRRVGGGTSRVGPQVLGRRPSALLDEGPDAGDDAAPPALQPVANAEATAVGALRVAPPSVSAGVFAGLVLGVAGWNPGDEEEVKLAELICSQGGTAKYGVGKMLDSLLLSKLDVCVCRGNGPPPFAASPERPQVALATPHWVRACVADGSMHARSAYPHFEPPKGPLPIETMSNCIIRVTALDSSGQSYRNRVRLEELVQLLGAQVAGQSHRKSDITQYVCVLPDQLESRLVESAQKRQIPLVSVQWLFDCYRMNGRQPEERYAITGSAAAEEISATPTQGSTFACSVLMKSTIFISPAALGSQPKLPQMGEELGAVVHTWRNVEELRLLLEQSAASVGQAVVLVEKEEACRGQLDACVESLPSASRGIFVQPSWLSETYSQRRRLPLESFAALPAAELEDHLPKRPRTGEASYVWQSADVKRLEEVSEQARALEMQSKAQQKVKEGLRLAELRREPSRT
eukprot:TRINITY_DN93656_c0_g1_i1.p1 TRINITY_DN93656_c0_g1~~TRINITY_DN93656_c0_g1_i1.p1  ORF type:complete len:866 (-),score=182.56 TRINITY_DN93656_c0_g1_i1:23-2620(-)